METQGISETTCMLRGMPAASGSEPSGPPQIRKHLRFFVAFVVALVLTGTLFAYELSLFLGPSLFVPAGTVVDQSGATIEFTVAGRPGQLVGRWHATQGGVLWLNPPDFGSLRSSPCIADRDWNGTANVSLWPGRYTLAIVPNPQGSLIVTDTLRVLYPGDRNATDHAFFASACGG